MSQWITPATINLVSLPLTMHVGMIYSFKWQNRYVKIVGKLPQLFLVFVEIQVMVLF